MADYWEQRQPLSTLLHPDETIEALLEASQEVYANPRSFPSDLAAAGHQYDPIVRPPVAVEQAIGTTCLRWISWSHTIVNVEHVLPLLAGSHVLAHELIYRPHNASGQMLARQLSVSEARQYSQRLHRRFVRLSACIKRSDTSNEELDRAANAVLGLETEASRERAADDDQGHLALKAIYFALRGKVEAIEHLDITPRQLNQYRQLQATHWSAKQRVFGARQRGESWGSLCERIVMEEATLTDGSMFRERRLPPKLTRLIQRYPGRTIAVLWGWSHHLTSRMIKLPDVVMQRQFADDASGGSVLRRVAQGSLWDVLHASNAIPLQAVRHLALFALCPHDLYDQLSVLEPNRLAELVQAVSSLRRASIDEQAPDGYQRAQARKVLTDRIFDSFLADI